MSFSDGNFRTEAATGRGGTKYSTFVYDELPADTDHGDGPLKITEQEMFDNIKYCATCRLPPFIPPASIVSPHPAAALQSTSA